MASAQQEGKKESQSFPAYACPAQDGAEGALFESPAGMYGHRQGYGPVLCTLLVYPVASGLADKAETVLFQHS